MKLPSVWNPAALREAERHLRRDKVLAGLIEKSGFRRIPKRTGTAFNALAESIISQQLSPRAAATICGRYGALLSRTRSSAEAAVLRLPPARLRSIGLSGAKAAYVRGLAKLVVSGDIDLAGLHRLSSAEVAERLTAVKGIGAWTANMFLIFYLGRPDVLPMNDQGLRRAIGRAYGLGKVSDAALEKLGAAWAPHQSLACWQLWQYIDDVPAMV